MDQENIFCQVPLQVSIATGLNQTWEYNFFRCIWCWGKVGGFAVVHTSNVDMGLLRSNRSTSSYDEDIFFNTGWACPYAKLVTQRKPSLRVEQHTGILDKRKHTELSPNTTNAWIRRMLLDDFLLPTNNRAHARKHTGVAFTMKRRYAKYCLYFDMKFMIFYVDLYNKRCTWCNRKISQRINSIHTSLSL